MSTKFPDYKHNNQKLFVDDDGKVKLMSYSTIVLIIDNGKIVLDESHNISVTTSKHITQAKSYLEENGFIF